MKRFIILLLALLPLLISAHPMEIRFDEMIRKCKLIFIGRYTGSNLRNSKFHIDIETILRGEYSSPEFTAGRAYGDPGLEKGERFIAFINQNDELEWAGFSKNIESRPIYMTGFYSYNSYDVIPNTLTFPQLKEYLSMKTFHGTITGNLEFYDQPSSRTVVSAVRFTIGYVYHENSKLSYESKTEGLTLIDFPKDPEIRFYGSSVTLIFRETNRPLIFTGFMDSVDSTGENFHSYFEVTKPDYLDSSLFFQYIAHPNYGQMYFECEIKTDDGKSYIFTYGLRWGYIGSMQYGDSLMEASTFGGPTPDEEGLLRLGDYFNPAVEIIFEKTRNKEGYQKLYDNNCVDFFSLMKMEPYTGTITVLENGVRVNKGKCTMSLKHAYFRNQEREN